MAFRNKYQREKQQISMDGGITWSDVTPSQYRKGELIEIASIDCNNNYYEGEYLTTEMLGDGTISLNRYVVGTTRDIYPLTNIAYSKNDGVWTSVAYDEEIDVSNGDVIRWKAYGYVFNNISCTDAHLPSGNGTIASTFVSSADYNVYGNPKSLLYYDFFETYEEAIAPPKKVTFKWLFNNYNDSTTGVVSAENLVMPSNITENSFLCMFTNQKKLTTAPAVLPATTLTNGCYKYMFKGCTSLVTAPELPATTLATSCYYMMFKDCTSLNYIKAMFTTTPEKIYTCDWVENVAASGTFVKNSAASWEVSGNSGVPTGWTILRASE